MVTPAQALAVWIQRTHPDLFLALVAKMNPNLGPLNGLGQDGGFLSSLVSGLSSAASAVGDYIASPQGSQTLSNLASAYFKSKTPVQGQIFNAQVQRAQMGATPVPISYVPAASGAATVPMIYTPTGAPQVVTPTVLQSLTPQPAWKQYLPWIIGGGSVLFLLLFALRR